MKIKSVKPNNRRKAFEVSTHSKSYWFPYANLEVRPSPKNKIERVFVDKELGREAFTYILESGKEGSVHIDHILDYNQDPTYLKEQVLYELTLEAQKRLEKSPLSRREIIRRLGTSASQFYRLVDQTNCKKSIGQLLALLEILGYEVQFVVREKA